jgi:hypothetical protein
MLYRKIGGDSTHSSCPCSSDIRKWNFRDSSQGDKNTHLRYILAAHSDVTSTGCLQSQSLPTFSLPVSNGGCLGLSGYYFASEQIAQSESIILFHKT